MLLLSRLAYTSALTPPLTHPLSLPSAWGYCTNVSASSSRTRMSGRERTERALIHRRTHSCSSSRGVGDWWGSLRRLRRCGTDATKSMSVPSFVFYISHFMTETTGSSSFVVGKGNAGIKPYLEPQGRGISTSDGSVYARLVDFISRFLG